MVLYHLVSYSWEVVLYEMGPGAVHTILFGEEKATVAGYCMISGFSRETDSTRDHMCFTKIFL